MFIVVFWAEYEEINTDGLLSKRGFERAKKAAMTVAATLWHRSMLKHHFTKSAKYTYKHKARTAKYQRRKIKLAERGKVEMGGQVDNVFSGTLMRNLQSYGSVRAFPSRVTLTMFGPRYVAANFKMNQPNKPKEITTTTPSEETRMARAIEREFVAAVGREKNRRRKVLK